MYVSNRTSEQMVKFRGVSKSYRSGSTRLQVLDGVHWNIAAGEVVVLLGRSGSGKSTLLNLVSGIDLPDTGAISVAGFALDQADDLQRTLFRRRNVGYIYQDFNLIANLSVRDNMALPLELNSRSDEVREATHALAEDLGIVDKLDLMPEQLSGGEQQRVAIGRALIHNPSLILADEPTGSLDRETGLAVLEVMDRLIKSSGTTLIMVTHSPEMVGEVDRLCTMQAGQIVDLDT